MLNLPARPNQRASSGSQNSADFKRLSSAISQAVREGPTETDDDLMDDMEVTEESVPVPVFTGYPVDDDDIRQGWCRSKLKWWIALGVTVAVGLLIVIIVLACTGKSKNMEDEEVIVVPDGVFDALTLGADDKKSYQKKVFFQKGQRLPFKLQFLISNKAEKDEGLCRAFIKSQRGNDPVFTDAELKTGYRIDEINGKDVAGLNHSQFMVLLRETLSLYDYKAPEDGEEDLFSITFFTYQPEGGKTCQHGHTMDKVSMWNEESVAQYLEEGYSLVLTNGWADRENFSPSDMNNALHFSAICDCCHASELKVIYHCFECGQEENGGHMFDKCPDCFEQL